MFYNICHRERERERDLRQFEYNLICWSAIPSSLRYTYMHAAYFKALTDRSRTGEQNDASSV